MVITVGKVATAGGWAAAFRLAADFRLFDDKIYKKVSSLCMREFAHNVREPALTIEIELAALGLAWSVFRNAQRW